MPKDVPDGLRKEWGFLQKSHTLHPPRVVGCDFRGSGGVTRILFAEAIGVSLAPR